MAELALGIAGVAGTIDVCIKFGKYLVNACKDYGQADELAHELSVRIHICWFRIASQLEIVKELEDNMTEDQRELQSHILRILQSKLEAATVVISKSDRHGSSKRNRALHFVSLRETLESTVTDLESWQKRFEPSWFQIIKTGSTYTEDVLKSATLTNTRDRGDPAREGLKFRQAFNNSETVKLAEKVLENLEMQVIPYCETELAVKQKENKYLIIDTVSRDTVALRDARELASRLRDSNPSTFGTLKCKGVVQLTREPSLKFVRLWRPRRVFKESPNEEHAQMLVCLVGFQLFRYADAPTNTSKTKKRSLVYQHPTRTGSKSVKFVMQHDIYSLGVCLLEIGLWRSLVEFHGATTRLSTVVTNTVDFQSELDPQAIKETLILLSRTELRSLGWYATSNKLYIAMEFFPDGDLYANIRDHRRLTDDECSHIISQVLSGVAVMHEAGFAHRDVKPQNILVYKVSQDLAPSSWWVKLADFGISKKLGAETTGTTLASGTPLYMAPELLQYDSRSILTEDYFKADVWAIGITAFFILTKSVPFKSQPAIFHYSGNLQDLATIFADSQLTEIARSFVSEVLKPQPGERPDAERAKQHAWIRHWLPEIPTPGALSSLQFLPAEVLFKTARGLTTEISTLASQTVSQRWTGDFHDLGILPKAPDHIQNLYNIPSRVGEIEIPIAETQWITKLENHRPASMGNLIRNPQNPGIWRDVNILQQLRGWISTGDIDMVRLLVYRGIDINAPDENGRTPLHLSASIGNVEMVRVLCEGGAVIDITSESGHTPLQLAAMKGHTDMAELLLEKGADIEASDSYGGFTPIGFAANMNHSGVTGLLLDKGANVEATNRVGHTPLISAARSGSEATVKLLLNHGAHIEATDKSGSTPLICAARAGSEGVIEHLIHHGANVNVSEYSGFTPMREARRKGHDAVEKLLLRAGASIDGSSPELSTSLHEAAQCGYYDQMIVNLRRNEENIEDKDDFGRTPLILAAREGHMDTAWLLFKYGANMEAFDHSNHTPLMAASDQGRTSMVIMLVRNKADVLARDIEGNTSMSLASRKGHIETVECLRDGNVPVDTPNNNGETPLILAAKGGHTAVARELLDAGADVNASDNKGFTPLITAAEQGHVETVKLLVDRKAQLDSTSLGAPAALIEAAKEGHEDVVEVLLEEGAAIETMDISGVTALVHSVRRNHEAVVALVLQIGANAEAEDENGEACLMLAIKNSNKAVIDLLTQHGAKKSWLYYRARMSLGY
ncbi:ankyrin repeat domain protein [Fusarium tjaetaba]|uniref:Ankyrin repeat domain protein n=1 Tax=Fusarium tjaetaba TaxID=1567544 RepID=A0A8H5REP0_9HYPO|nr:ankyrin repeat domain protein [Fusarium tjaetaba]KAF5631162.1 ankyrin repeat domain protein [Fusarium tjaetaba]